MGNYNKLCLFLFNKLGDMVDSKLHSHRFFAWSVLLAFCLFLCLLSETSFLFCFSLWADLVQQLEKLSGYKSAVFLELIHNQNILALKC